MGGGGGGRGAGMMYLLMKLIYDMCEYTRPTASVCRDGYLVSINTYSNEKNQSKFFRMYGHGESTGLTVLGGCILSTLA